MTGPRRGEISAGAQDILSSAYEITPESVAADGDALANWVLPFDELIAQICGSYGWDAEMGAVYIGALRSALVGREPASPWLDE